MHAAREYGVDATGITLSLPQTEGRKMREVLVDEVVRILSDLDSWDWDYRSDEVRKKG